MPRLRPHLLLFSSCATLAAGCGRTGAAAVKTESTPQPIVVTTVEAHDVRRAIDVVGTLAAEEEVTVSSEVEGRVLQHRGRPWRSRERRTAAGRPRPREAAVSARPAACGVEPRHGALRRLGSVGAAAGRRATPDVAKAAAERDQAEQAFRRASELQKRSLIAQQQLDDADATLKAKRAATKPRSRARATCAPTSTPSRRT